MRQIETVDQGPLIVCDACAARMRLSLRFSLREISEATGLMLDERGILEQCMGEDVTGRVPYGQPCDLCGDDGIVRIGGMLRSNTGSVPP